MMLFDPGKQWTCVVQADANFGMSFQDFDEGQIAVRVGLLEDMVEIANGLVRVDKEDQMELRWHGNEIGLLKYSIT